MWINYPFVDYVRKCGPIEKKCANLVRASAHQERNLIFKPPRSVINNIVDVTGLLKLTGWLAWRLRFFLIS